MIAILLQSVTGFLTVFSPWYEMFLIFKFISAVATGGTMLISFVLRKFWFLFIYFTYSVGTFSTRFSTIHVNQRGFDNRLLIFSYGNCGIEMALGIIRPLPCPVPVRFPTESTNLLFNTNVVRIPNGSIHTTDFPTFLLLVSTTQFSIKLPIQLLI